MGCSLLEHFDFMYGCNYYSGMVNAFSCILYPYYSASFSCKYVTRDRIEIGYNKTLVKGVGKTLSTQRMAQFSGSVPFVFSLFVILFFMNVLGSLPYLYSLSSHIGIVFCMSFPLWVVVSITVFPQNFYYLFGESFSGDHPLAITVMLLLSELVSIFARPFTLTVRMCVNIIIGQVVLALVGAKVSSLIFLAPFTWGSAVSLIFMGFLLVSLFFIETLVVLIQTGVFIMLLVFFVEDGVLTK
uniref:ATP synthase F0 subunit 6 n=1 Tax=Xylonora corona TaxID=2939326 RepID=UPI002027BF70|nr:ATP synthase F0 subunit 6 [Xylonora corona]UPX88876.1 ATP synthase F0 subunit 6 [Xylonora corona]